ncbi:MAG: hypothetical protein JW834_01505 [Candidatus Diapherotrites archaeon]|nr:hypothetical protein [Candidatus Diapherotrites archaeon]
MEKVVESYRKALAAIKANIASVPPKHSSEVQKKLEAFRLREKELHAYIRDDNEEGVSALLSELHAFGKEVEAKTRKGFWERLLPAKKEVGITGVDPQVGREMEKWLKTLQRQHEAEMEELRKSLAEKDVEVEGLKGTYSKLSEQFRSERKRMEEERVKDRSELSGSVQSLKKQVDDLNKTLAQEFGQVKETYKGFGFELLNLAVNLSEIEERLDRGGEISELDIINLRGSVQQLEHRLARVEAERKKQRMELLEAIKEATGGKDTKAVKAEISALRKELKENSQLISSRTSTELRDAYAGLLKKLDDVEKNATQKALSEVRKRVDELEKEEIIELRREVEQQAIVDAGLSARIDSMKPERAERKSGKGKTATAKKTKNKASRRPRQKKTRKTAGVLSRKKGK